MKNTITLAQLETYRRDGFLRYGQLFTDKEMTEIRKEIELRVNSVGEDSPNKHMLNWHHHDKWLLSLAMRSEVVDLVEGLIGPDIALFNTRILSKAPDTKYAIPWHQDAIYWPLEPCAAISFWLAVDDVTEENGVMLAIPGMHRCGLLEHIKTSRDSTDNDQAFDKKIHQDFVDESKAVKLTQASGECSFHDVYLPHMSLPNLSPHRRCAFIVRYIPTYVKLIRTKRQIYEESYPLYWVRGNLGANWYINR
jgi:chlorinating enzyme